MITGHTSLSIKLLKSLLYFTLSKAFVASSNRARTLYPCALLYWIVSTTKKEHKDVEYYFYMQIEGGYY